MSDIREQCAILDEEAYAIRSLACAFQQTGNNQVAKQLHFAASQIMESAEAIRKEDSRILTERVREAEQSSFNLLNACLNADKIVEANDRHRAAD